ncbi:MAG: insulinase family protein [Chitinophagaceae bacterium]|nr:insulinase family protein [Chitinophagaceae bacterium]MCW5904189.1 insulinase family protein [Chitinophagaceae bacterium]
MIQYNRHTLNNGLKILVHEDASTPMAVVNIMYNVGAKDEDANKTGFAHLFEHLMFGGSINIPSYDEPLQRAGGENNAYTTNDLTNYYCVLPAKNIETAFWLESDRMLSLAFSKKSLDVQRKVVCEEFKEHYINKPYGDIWHKMRNLAYTTHPYKWMTIGKELSHVENATIEDVKNFFFKFYRPNNAILVVAGNVATNNIIQLAEKWFGNISSGEKYERNLPIEPQQQQAKFLEIKADVPLDAIIKTWHIDARLTKGYYTADLITEIFGGGNSSRLYQSLVKEKQLFSDISCFHFGSIEPGLLTIEGKLTKGISMQKAEEAIQEELIKLTTEQVNNNELQKVKNRTESIITFEDISIMSRANNLALYELLGDAALINNELKKYQEITEADILQYAQTIFDEKNSSTIHYYSKN